MKKVLISLACLLGVTALKSQDMKTIQLEAPSLAGTSSLKEAFEKRSSDRAYSGRELSRQHLSDLLWAANGFNRADKRTAATAINQQEIDIYVCMADGAYLYDPAQNLLRQVTAEDVRGHIAGGQEFAATAPVVLLIVADMNRCREDSERMRTMTAYDAGIVSQNIYLYCAGAGLGTVCRASMDHTATARALGLTDKHVLHLNHPVGYKVR